MFDFAFFLNSILLGIGLSMDAFSVSLANGLTEPKMGVPRMFGISGTFAVFQAVMPLTGWICVYILVEKVQSIKKYIPYVALILLLYIAIKMMYDGLKNKAGDCVESVITLPVLIFQGVATSIDALSVGFAISNYNFAMTLVCSVIISAVTFCICNLGLIIGRFCGMQLANKAFIFGSLILLVLVFEIIIKDII